MTSFKMKKLNKNSYHNIGHQGIKYKKRKKRKKRKKSGKEFHFNTMF